MEQITMDEQAREKIMAQLEGSDAAKTPKHRIHPLRTALLAACVCLILVGSVFAGQVILSTRFWGADENNYKVSVGGLITFTQEQLSPQMVQDMQETAENDPCGEIRRSFRTWTELEDYIGVPLSDNPMLEESAESIYTTDQNDMLTGDYAWHEWCEVEDLGEKAQFQYSVDTWLWVSKMLNCDIYGVSQIDGVQVGLLLSLYGDGDEAPSGNFGFSGGHGGENDFRAQEYVMKNGCEAQLVYRYADKSSDAPLECRAYFAWRGVLYRIHFECPDGRPVDPAVVERVMDAFE